jgi:translocator protein
MCRAQRTAPPAYLRQRATWSEDMEKKSIRRHEPRDSVLLFIGSIALPIAAGAIGSIFTMSSIGSWYSALVKPPFNPPNWVFGPVWTALYILMGISLYIVLKKTDDIRPVAVFVLQIILNTLWSFLFFGLRSPLAGMIGIVLLWLAIAINIAMFYRIDRKAAYLLIPYILWVSFAAILNLSIYILNR